MIFLVMIFATVGLICFTALFFCILAFLFSHYFETRKERFQFLLPALLVFGLGGFMLLVPSFFDLTRAITYKYIDPTYIVRTNDTTHIIYIGEGGIHGIIYRC